MAKRKALGRGLNALIPDAPAPNQDKNFIEYIDPEKISPNPFQPREKFDRVKLDELRDSISENGIVQPITVRRYNGGFQLISGERRLRAVKELEYDSIPAFILDVQSDEEMLELSIIENIHREDLNPIDIAKGYKRLIDECHLTQEMMAQKLGKDRSTITNFLRLLKLPSKIQTSLRDSELSMGHARALLSLSHVDDQMNLWKKIVSQGLSVRKVEQIVRNFQKVEVKKPVVDKREHYFGELENKLRTKLATKIMIKKKSKGGSIEIDFYSDDDLDRLVGLILD